MLDRFETIQDINPHPSDWDSFEDFESYLQKRILEAPIEEFGYSVQQTFPYPNSDLFDIEITARCYDGDLSTYIRKASKMPSEKSMQELVRVSIGQALLERYKSYENGTPGNLLLNSKYQTVLPRFFKRFGYSVSVVKSHTGITPKVPFLQKVRSTFPQMNSGHEGSARFLEISFAARTWRFTLRPSGN